MLTESLTGQKFFEYQTTHDKYDIDIDITMASPIEFPCSL